MGQSETMTISDKISTVAQARLDPMHHNAVLAGNWKMAVYAQPEAELWLTNGRITCAGFC